MGGCCSKPMEHDQPVTPHDEPKDEEVKNEGFGNLPFKEFSLSDLKTATKNFSSGEIISENADDSSNVVYKGSLAENLGFVAVKRLKDMPSADRGYFMGDAKAVWELSHKRLVKLIGSCCNADELLLVAEFLPNDNLAKRLFHQKNQTTMEWSMRLRVAYHIAEALYYCSTAGFVKYSNLSAYTILFDKDDDACLSSFGFLREIVTSNLKIRGSVNLGNVTYRFGIILVNLLTGVQITPSHAPEIISGMDLTDLIDPNLEENFSKEEANILLKLASKCLQCTDDIKTLISKELVATLEALHTKREIPFPQLLEMTRQDEVGVSSSQRQEVPTSDQLSALGQACLKSDLNDLHDVLSQEEYIHVNYNKTSFDDWLEPSKSGIVDEDARHADLEFKRKNYLPTIEKYTEIIKRRRKVSSNVYGRRCFCYLSCNQVVSAVVDAIKAQEEFPQSPIGFYLHSMILAGIGSKAKSAEVFKQATNIEAELLQRTMAPSFEMHESTKQEPSSPSI